VRDRASDEPRWDRDDSARADRLPTALKGTPGAPRVCRLAASTAAIRLVNSWSARARAEAPDAPGVTAGSGDPEPAAEQGHGRAG
jgi:hypothetical protein